METSDFLSYGVGVAAELARAAQIVENKTTSAFGVTKTEGGYQVRVAAVGFEPTEINVIMDENAFLKIYATPAAQSEMVWPGFVVQPISYNIPCGMSLVLSEASLSKGILTVTLIDLAAARTSTAVTVKDPAAVIVAPPPVVVDQPAPAVEPLPVVVVPEPQPEPVVVVAEPVVVVEPAPVVVEQPVVVVEQPAPAPVEQTEHEDHHEDDDHDEDDNEPKKAGDAETAVTGTASGVEEVVNVPVTVNADNPAIPTVEVTLPVEMPQIVSVEVVPVVDPAADAAVELKDATVEVHDDAILLPVATPEGTADVVVAVMPEVKAELESQGVDIVQVVGQAIADNPEKAPELPVVEEKGTELAELPPVTVTVPAVDATTEQIVANPATDVTVQVPEIASQVMEVTLENPADGSDIPTIVVENNSEKIAENTEVVAVVTPEGQPDAVIAVTPEVKAELESHGVDVVAAVESAMKQADTEVVSVVEAEIPAAPVVEPAANTQPTVTV